MINHISIGVNDPEKVANVLAELWGGYALPFPPSPGGYIAFADDDSGIMVEVLPIDVQFHPGKGLPNEEGFTRQTDTEVHEAVFTPGHEAQQYSSVHLNLNSPLSEAEIKAIAAREDWRCFTANRAGGLFQLIELWIEDRFMFEVNTPEMTQLYRDTVTPKAWADFLQMPLPPRYAANHSHMVN